MAFPKKKSRKITVDGQDFRWMIKVEYDKIKLSIISEEFNAQKLFAIFKHSINGSDSNMLAEPFIIQPDLVRRTILHGLSNGYRPDINGNDLNLGDLSDNHIFNENEIN